MTVNATDVKQSFNCNGSLYEFDFDFPIDAADDFKLQIRDSDGLVTDLEVTTQFEISTDGVDYSSGGTITTVSYASGARQVYAWPTGNTLLAYRETPLTQGSTYKNNRTLDQDVLEDDFDRFCMIVQELDDKRDRAITVPRDDTVVSLELPKASLRAGKYIIFSSTGAVTVIEDGPAGAVIGDGHSQNTDEGTNQTTFYFGSGGVKVRTGSGMLETRNNANDDYAPLMAKEIGFDAEYNNGNSGTSKAINWRNGNKQKITMTGNCTLTFAAPTIGVGHFQLKVIQDGTGSRTITWPTIKWAYGVAPTLSTAASSIDIITLYYDGSAWYGSYATGFATP